MTGLDARVGQQLPAYDISNVASRQVAAYAAASLDDNPIHLDVETARAVGLDAPVIHGMLIMGLFEEAVRRWQPDLFICHVSARFLKPTLVDRPVGVRGRIAAIDDGTITIRMIAQDEAQAPLCLGAVTVRSAK